MVGYVFYRTQAAQALERETIAQHEELGRLHARLNELRVREKRRETR